MPPFRGPHRRTSGSTSSCWRCCRRSSWSLPRRLRPRRSPCSPHPPPFPAADPSHASGRVFSTGAASAQATGNGVPTPPWVQLFPRTSRDPPSLYILFVSFLPGRLFRMLRFVRCVPVSPRRTLYPCVCVDPSTNLLLRVLCFRRITTIVGSAAHRPALPPWEHPSGRGSEALSLRKLLAPGLPRGWGTRG